MIKKVVRNQDKLIISVGHLAGVLDTPAPTTSAPTNSAPIGYFGPFWKKKLRLGERYFGPEQKTLRSLSKGISALCLKELSLPTDSAPPYNMFK